MPRCLSHGKVKDLEELRQDLQSEAGEYEPETPSLASPSAGVLSIDLELAFMIQKEGARDSKPKGRAI